MTLYTNVTAPTPEEVSNAQDVADAINSRLFNFQELVTVFGNSISENLNNYGTWFCRESGGMAMFYANAGVGGNVTPQMLSRLSDIPDETTLCFVMEATNDANTAGEGLVTPEQHTINMGQIFDYIVGKGIKPALVLSPPHNDPDRSMRVNEMNMRDWVMARKRNIPVFNPWDKFTDPADGSWVSGASDDGTHPNSATQRAAGVQLITDYKMGNYYTPLPRINDIGGVVNNRNLVTPSSGNANIPNRFATNNNPVSLSLTETPLALGNTFSSNWANTEVFLNSSRFAVTAGDHYLFVARFSSTFNSGSTPYDLCLEYDVSVGGVTRKYFVRECEVGISDTTLTQEFVVPDGVSTIRLVLSAPAGTFDVDFNIGQLEFFNLTEIGW